MQEAVACFRQAGTGLRAKVSQIGSLTARKEMTAIVYHCCVGIA